VLAPPVRLSRNAYFFFSDCDTDNPRIFTFTPEDSARTFRPNRNCVVAMRATNRAFEVQIYWFTFVPVNTIGIDIGINVLDPIMICFLVLLCDQKMIFAAVRDDAVKAISRYVQLVRDSSGEHMILTNSRGAAIGLAASGQ